MEALEHYLASLRGAVLEAYRQGKQVDFKHEPCYSELQSTEYYVMLPEKMCERYTIVIREKGRFNPPERNHSFTI